MDAPFRVLEVGVGTSALGAGLTAALRRRMHRGNGGGGGGGGGANGNGGDRAVAYVGVDAVPSAVALQRRHYPDQRLFVADARDLSDRFGAVMLRDWFGEGGAAAAAAAAASGAGEIDLVVDKGTPTRCSSTPTPRPPSSRTSHRSARSSAAAPARTASSSWFARAWTASRPATASRCPSTSTAEGRSCASGTRRCVSRAPELETDIQAATGPTTSSSRGSPQADPLCRFLILQ